MQPIPRNPSKRAARKPSSTHSRRCGQAQESLAMPADAEAAPACPNPEPASTSKAGPPCPRPEARNPSGDTRSRPTLRRSRRRLTSQAHRRPHRDRRPRDGRTDAPTDTSCPMYPQPASRALQPAPVATSCPESSPSPCAGAGPHAAAARPDSNVSFDKRNDERRNDEASPAGPGPARRPSRSRSKPGRRADERGSPLSCSPPQSHRYARMPASDVHERSRPHTRPRRGQPRRWSCLWRIAGSGLGRRSVRAPAAQLLQKRIARVPVEVNHHAPCNAQALGR